VLGQDRSLASFKDPSRRASPDLLCALGRQARPRVFRRDVLANLLWKCEKAQMDRGRPKSLALPGELGETRARESDERPESLRLRGEDYKSLPLSHIDNRPNES
jgi:hypothetical protein